MSWGPQPDGHAALPAGPPRLVGTRLLVLPIVFGVAGFVFGARPFCPRLIRLVARLATNA